ncbi:glycerophosphodiester phosphodiesterase family protein [Arthrobacter sp. ATA002]|uniref:glycerophosphodiester phosphodiesterase n=1 Tax=Arthrobacter sp. ATA002 TaxID=2991715 RepID=UPI0022A785C8|nr:glycerophosphodiester phosphodiesterase family protein [Arthrobacter sp. ATA002]WAP51374.1 glycerophosphodiester phosphodiesterase family protein [Arthrobacter sp. ATA002]
MKSGNRPGPLVVGHRGNSGLAPENTAAAFARALAAGADMVETDVRLSADGEPFLCHDGTGGRTTNVAEVFPERADAPITSFTAAELRRLDAGGWFGEEFAGEPVLFLSELPAAVDFALGINLEIKAPQESPGVEEAVAAALREPDWMRLRGQNPVAVSSFDPEAVRAFARLAPEVPAWQLVETVPDAAVLAGGAVRGLQGIVADHHSLTPDSAAAVRAAGLGLWVYTVNDTAEMSRMIDLGADALITDFPAVLVELLEVKPN